jgi:hypothetical protein
VLAPAWRLAAAALLTTSLSSCGSDYSLQVRSGTNFPATLAMVTADPAPAEGSTVAITVTIENAQDVVSVPFKLRYDETAVSFVDGTVGPFLAAGGGQVTFLTGTDPTNPGVLSVGLAILGGGPGVTGQGDLCTLRFEILPGAAAAGPLTLQPFSVQVYAPGLKLLPSTFGLLTLTPVP